MASNSPPPDYNYTTKTIKQLRGVLRRRLIAHKHRKLKAQLIATLAEADRPLREAAEERDRLKREANRLEQETLTATSQARGLQDFGTTIDEIRAALQQDDKRKLERESLTATIKD
jgi:hypothetical protein